MADGSNLSHLEWARAAVREMWWRCLRGLSTQFALQADQLKGTEKQVDQ